MAQRHEAFDEGSRQCADKLPCHPGIGLSAIRRKRASQRGGFHSLLRGSGSNNYPRSPESLVAPGLRSLQLDLQLNQSEEFDVKNKSGEEAFLEALAASSLSPTPWRRGERDWADG